MFNNYLFNFQWLQIMSSMPENWKHIIIHCVKSVEIRSFFWSVFSRIQTEYGPEKARIWTLFTQ